MPHRSRTGALFPLAEGVRAEERESAPGLIVIGGHGPQTRSLFGSDDVTRQVLRFAERPVLVVPEDA